jgi:hypothetical protein
MLRFDGATASAKEYQSTISTSPNQRVLAGPRTLAVVTWLTVRGSRSAKTRRNSGASRGP